LIHIHKIVETEVGIIGEGNLLDYYVAYLLAKVGKKVFYRSRKINNESRFYTSQNNSTAWINL